MQAGQIHGGLVGLYGGPGGHRRGSVLLQRLVRDEALEFQGLVAFHIGPGLHQLGLIPGQIGLGLAQPGVEVTRIEPHQHVALLDVLTLPERHGLDLAVHP